MSSIRDTAIREVHMLELREADPSVEQYVDAVLAALGLREDDLAAAWDAGHRHRQRRGSDGCRCFASCQAECGCGLYGTGTLLSLADNPYRQEAP